MQEDDNREEVTVTRTGEAWPQSLRWGTVELHRAPTARWSAAPAPGGSQYLQKEEDLEMGIHQIVLFFFLHANIFCASFMYKITYEYCQST